MKLISKLVLAAAVAGLALAGAASESTARGAKAKKASYCAPGSVRVTKKTCGKWGCHFQRCWWDGKWYPSVAYCIAPWCPRP